MRQILSLRLRLAYQNQSMYQINDRKKNVSTLFCGIFEAIISISPDHLIKHVTVGCAT